MNIFRQLTEKPWLTERSDVVALHDGRLFPLPTAKLGLRAFLAVVLVVFSLMFAAYAERKVFSDWHSLPIPSLLWLNTVILILSSAALQWVKGKQKKFKNKGGSRSDWKKAYVKLKPGFDIDYMGA